MQTSRTFLALLFAALLLVVGAPAVALELSGQVVDAADDTPMGGVRVEVDGLDIVGVTDSDGRYRIDVGEHAPPHTLLVRQPDSTDARWVNQWPDREATLRLFSGTSEPVAGAWGYPTWREAHEPATPVRITDLPRPVTVLGVTVGPTLPATIRVGRRFASSCAGNDVTRIDEIDFETYVQGVLVPEIGVFKRIAGGPESSAAVFQAFAVAARSYALWFYLRDPDAAWHIDDTACNQRYDDARDAFVAAQVEATRGLIMVAARDRTLLDKLEYAASCGRNGTRPEYQDAIIDDVTGQQACVGSWCGHDDCAAHEDNPEVPGTDRCLVRGICQWGSAERSMRGDTALEILAHYQPNLVVTTVGATTSTGQLVGYVRFDDIYTGPGVAGVTVEVDDGSSTITNADGYFAIAEVTAGERAITYSGEGIVAASRTRVVEPGITNWASIAVARDTAIGGDTAVADAGVDDAGPVDAGSEDTANSDAVVRDDVRTDDAAARDDASLVPPDSHDATAAGDVGATLDGAVGADAEVPLYTQVGPDGLGDTGLACAASSAASGGGAWLLLLVVSMTRRRQRSH